MSLMNVCISSIIMNLFEIFIYHSICKEKVDFKSPKLYFVFILQTFFIITNYMLTNSMIKVIVTFLIMIISIKILFKEKNTIKCINIAFISEVIIIISEIIFATSVSIWNRIDNTNLVNYFEGEIITNFSISVLSFFISKIPIVNRMYQSLNRLTDNLSKYIIIVGLGFIVFVCSLLYNLSYYNYSQTISLIVNSFIITAYFVIVILIIYKDNKYNKIYRKYSTSMDELEEYESIINEYRVINHENKNQLNTIKGMTSNKKIHEYIDKILELKTEKSELALKKALLIPTGGLRGLLYSKLVTMKNYNINYNVQVDKKVTNRIISNISTNDMMDLCQIIGVFLDNAIDEVKNLDKKNIIISIYMIDSLNVEIINNIGNSFDINKIDKLGFTSKGKGHGYGLTLVNNILKNNHNLVNERYINSNMFKQIIKLKKVQK